MSSPIRVLLVEDDIVQRKVVQKSLEGVQRVDLEVYFAESLAALNDHLKKQTVDVILLDLGLPDSQGYATFETVVAQHKDIPLVIMTATDDEELALDSLRKGAQDYIVKGAFDHALLLRVILYAIERKRGEEELRKAREQVVQANKFESIARLARGVAHEVLNPLAIIKLGVSLLFDKAKKTDGSNDEQASLELMKDAIERADAVIKGLLAFSDPQTETKASYSLKTIVEDVILLLQHECEQRKIDVKNELVADFAPIQMQRQKVQQAILSVLNNAIDVMDNGGDLTLRMEKQQRTDGKPGLALIIEDTGPGMPEAVLQQIADPFVTEKKKWESLGLGLSVVKTVMSEHEAELKFENRAEGGLRVSMIFPEP